jgi:hypothetical protein
MVGSDDDRGRSRKPGAEDRGRSNTGQVFWLRLKTMVDGLLVIWPQTTVSGFPICASKSTVTVG